MASLKLDSDWSIPASDLEVRYMRSSGPGGQHVNKVASKVEVRLKLAATEALTPAQKARLRQAFPSQVTSGGEFVLTSDRHRSQHMNQQDALEKLAERLRRVRYPPRKRIPTKVSRSAKRRRLEGKRQRAELKKQRRPVDRD